MVLVKQYGKYWMLKSRCDSGIISKMLECSFETLFGSILTQQPITCSESIKTLDLPHWHDAAVVIVTLEHIQHIKSTVPILNFEQLTVYSKCVNEDVFPFTAWKKFIQT